MTRAAPAKLFGFKDRGQLGEGSVADVAVYAPNDDIAKTFRHAHLVFKDGDLVVRDGRISHYRWGKALKVNPAYDKAINRRLGDYYERSLWRLAQHVRGAGAYPAAQGSVQGGRMREIIKNGVRIDDTFAEAFPMRGTAIIITAPNLKWARQAAVTMTGFATSVIGCGVEAGIDREIAAERRPMGVPACACCCSPCRPTCCRRSCVNRAGQCVLTSPGSAVLRRSRQAPTGWQSAIRCAISAMAGRSPRSFSTGTSGASRLWTASSSARRRPASPKRRSAAAISSSWATSFETTMNAAEAAIEAMRRRRWRDHAVPRRHRALGLEGRLEI